MIVIDMDMPTDCIDCPIDCFPYGAEDTDYSTTNRPSCCPIKCDIEDIKAEIKEHQRTMMPVIPVQEALSIIDKHTKGENK